jgi:Zn-dependent peptidase ImmA (M78 family)/DNA-binding XRE family transcriptional regulator
MAKAKIRSITPANTADITGKIVTWARKRLGKSQEEIAKQIGRRFRAAHIEDWEKERTKPPFDKAKKLATALHIPFGFLFLTEIPTHDVKVPDRRTVGNVSVDTFSPEFLDQLRNLLLKQEWYRDYVSEQGKKPLSFVGRFNTSSPVDDVAADIRKELGITHDFRVVARTWEDFLSNLMASAESAGILMIRSGVVGSASRRHLSVKEFRGFAHSDPIAPLIFINGRDSTSAQVFTLAHELAHLWIGKGGVSNPNPKHRSTDEHNLIERFCNKVAAEVLVPRTEFLRQWLDSVSIEQNVYTLVRYFRVSEHVILRQAFEHDKLSRNEYEKRIEVLEDRFRAAQSGGNFFINVRVRNSRTLAVSVLDAIHEKRVSLRDAATLLGCKVPTLKTIATELR